MSTKYELSDDEVLAEAGFTFVPRKPVIPTKKNPCVPVTPMWKDPLDKEPHFDYRGAVVEARVRLMEKAK